MGLRTLSIVGVVAVASHIHPFDIVGFDVRNLRNTAVLETWFMGKQVYVSNVRKTNAKRG